MQIRAETSEDRAAVEAVNESAFETPAESNLVNVLREQARPVVSLVADDGGKICGHILFSPVVLSGHPELKIMGLAPMAVVPERQREGIGSDLVRAGLAQCRKLAVDAVVVLGHPEYYPRFGFTPAAGFGIDCEFDAPQEAFMAVELVPGCLGDARGTVEFHEAFRTRKGVSRLPRDVLKRYEKWKDIVQLSGPLGLRQIKGFNDEALRGEWKGHRSSRLSRQFRVIYRVERERVLVEVVSVTAHDYRKK